MHVTTMHVLYAVLVINSILYYRMLHCVLSLDLHCWLEQWLMWYTVMIMNISMITFLYVQVITRTGMIIITWKFVMILKASLLVRVLLQ